MKYTSFEEYCDYEEKNDIGKFKEVDKVCIGCPKPCITSIVEGSVKVELKDTKVVKDCNGFKLIVEGCKYIKIQYCSNDCCACGKIFTDTFVVPFKESIYFCGCYRDIRHVDIDVCDCSVKKIDSRCACVKSTICVEPIFECPEYEDWDCDWDCNCKIHSSCNRCKR
jgi:hypothetical protein